MGFVSRVVGPAAGAAAPSRQADVVEASLAMASEIAKQSPVAVFGTKRNLVYARDHGVDDGLEYAATWSGAALQAQDLGTAMRAAAPSSAARKPASEPKKKSRGAGASAGSRPRFSKL